MTYSQSVKQLLDDIDVSDANYEKAIHRYEAITSFINGSELQKYSPDIFVQGSFKLGTAIKPLTSEGSYDIDIVCKLNLLNKDMISQKNLKKITGDVINEYVKSNGMKNEAENGKRCWTVNYVDEDNFHLDILPSIPEGKSEVILITDKRNAKYSVITSDWEISNPQGYYNWFTSISKYSEYKQHFARILNEQIETIPYYKVKTPLQRVIQVLKRHAEVMFQGNMELKPSSIIITTLVAKTYHQLSDTTSDFIQLVSEIISHLEKNIEYIDNVPCVLNPVNSEENLSSKWAINEIYFQEFIRWLRQIEFDFSVNQKKYNSNERFNLIKRSLRKSTSLQQIQESLQLLPYRKPSKWKMSLWKDVWIETTIYRNGFRPKKLESGQEVDKNIELKFEVQADNLKLYDIYWQVTNTGREAERVEQLRGDFYESEIKEGKKVRIEETRYSGKHYVEAYLINSDNVCVGKSLPFIVCIK